MIKKTEEQFPKVTEANCDCCGESIKVEFGRIYEHMTIGGYQGGNNLEAIVCIKCMEDKLGFINIQKKRNTIGDC
jgi:hypothetical protein